MADQKDFPSSVSEHLTWFDRFAGKAGDIAGRAPFFGACVLLLVVWAPTLLFLQFDTSQLLINTATTIITFLLVAIIQNTQNRDNKATQKKLNAMAKAQADTMIFLANQSDDAEEVEALIQDIEELESAVGLENRESS